MTTAAIKTWFEDGNMIVREIAHEDFYIQSEPEPYYWDNRFVRWEGATRISASPYRRALTLRQIEIAARQVCRPKAPGS